MDIVNYLNDKHKVYLDRSEIHGVGLFASTKIHEGELIFRDDVEMEIHAYKIFDLLSCGANVDIVEQLKLSRCHHNDVLHLRVPNYVVFSDYINHSKDSNCKIVNRQEWTATKEINKGQEILFNYNSLPIQYKKDF